MAENDDQNDEYKYDEFDSVDNESMDETESKTPKETGKEPKPPQKNVKRNSLIAIGIIVFIMLMYKLLGGMFSGKSTKEAAKGSIPPAPIASAVTTPPPPPLPPQPQPQPVQPEVAPPQPEVAPPQPVQSAVPPVVQVNDTALKEKVDSIETNQQNVQSQVSTMNDQVNNVNNNVNNLSAQISKLNQTVADLTTQLSRQSEDINILMARTAPKPIRRVLRPRIVGELNIYYINAVIPGRAWLIGTNGSTLTVREGTKIAGYGVVRLIDSLQGRVLTTSGRVIRFSQEDS